MSRLHALGLLALVVGCGPNPPAPVKVRALIPNASGVFQPTEVVLSTVSNVTSLTGDIITFVGSTKIVLDSSDPLQANIVGMSDEQRYEVLVKNKGGDVRVHYVEQDGVLSPADFHSWNMVSTYYNFEKAYLYFNSLYDGVDPKDLRPFRVHYWSDAQLDSPDSQIDNMFYLSVIKSFVVSPFKNEQKIPLSMNIGAVGHEAAHRVFNAKALSNAGINPAIINWAGLPFNLLKSLDEGLADFHGYSVTCSEATNCRPDFLTLSFAESPDTSFRNVARLDACMDDSLRNSMESFTPYSWTHSSEMYKVGNIIAVTLYQAGNQAGKLQILQKALIKAYDDETAGNRGLRQLIEDSLSDSRLFTPERVANVIVAHVSDLDLRRRLCTELTSRLQLRCTSFPCTPGGGPNLMPACDGLTAGQDSTICPTITPQP